MFAAILVAPFVLAAASAGAGWVRANVDPTAGAFVTIAVSVGFGAAWLWISTKLPAPDVPWTAFLPGAILLAVGFTALHVFTVYYLAEKLANSSALYGAFGLAATVLFYLYLVGRGVIWAAELNAVVWDVRHPSPHEPAVAADGRR
jgi:uncharacterized BrkB/YihY/UPF0761 family membrane protein